VQQLQQVQMAQVAKPRGRQSHPITLCSSETYFRQFHSFKL
jgi:hypothetical protein